MRTEWNHRNPIVANLLNPAFCGEVIRRAALSYNENASSTFPYAYSFLVLPILLHEETRNRLPKSTKSYLFAWVEMNDDLFYNFSKRARDMVPYTKESVMFLLQNEHIEIDSTGGITVEKKRMKSIKNENMDEFEMIMNRSKMLGKWLSKNTNVNSVYSFFRITP